MKPSAHIVDYLANGIYQLAAVTDMFTQDLERRLHRFGLNAKQKKKMVFSRFMASAKGVHDNCDQLMADCWDAAPTAVDYQENQEDNAMAARLYLLYLDRIHGDAHATAELYDYMKNKPGRGVVSDAILETYMIK